MGISGMHSTRRSGPAGSLRFWLLRYKRMAYANAYNGRKTNSPQAPKTQYGGPLFTHGHVFERIGNFAFARDMLAQK